MRQQRYIRTDNGFAPFVDFERDLGIANEKREVEDIFHGLRKAFRIDDKSEKVDPLNLTQDRSHLSHITLEINQEKVERKA